MTTKYSEADLEKIRYQMGQIIKSWSKVDRLIENDYVAYTVNNIIFCYFMGDLLLLSNYDQELKTRIKSKYHLVQAPSEAQSIASDDHLALSLQEYEFTDLLPVVEEIYRYTILSPTH